MRNVRQLNESDSEQYAQLRGEALSEAPLSFGASLETDVPAKQLWSGASAIFGAFEDERLAGLLGVWRDRHAKLQHKVQLWGMYVTPAARRRGIAAELLEAALRHARSLPEVAWVQLSVSDAAPAAQRLYERFGFEVWGTEPDALRHEGASVAEFHMALRISRR